MIKNIVLVFGLLVSYFVIKKFLFNPRKSKANRGFSKRYDERKKINGRHESLHQNR